MYGILCLHDRLSEVWSSGTLCLYRILLRQCLNDPLLLFWSRQAAEPLQNPLGLISCNGCLLDIHINSHCVICRQHAHAKRQNISFVHSKQAWALVDSQARHQVNARSRGIHMESNTSFEELLRRVESGAYLLGLLVAKLLFTCVGSWTPDTMFCTSEKKEDGISNRPHTVILASAWIDTGRFRWIACVGFPKLKLKMEKLKLPHLPNNINMYTG